MSEIFPSNESRIKLIEEEALHIDSYKSRLIRDVNDFFCYYHQQMAEDPESFPCCMNLQDWDEQFLLYLQHNPGA